MIRRAIIKILILALPVCLYGQGEQLVVNPPAGGEERLFSFENPRGSIKITGYDGDLIVVTGSLRYPEPAQKTPDGFNRIEKSPIEIRAEVNGQNVLLLCEASGKTVDFDIKMPSRFSMKLKSADNGNVDVLNIYGEIEIINSNGNITLGNITGSAILSSVYGNINAVFREVKTGTPMMFTSFEGDISLTIPAATNANLKMKSGKGEILSEIDFQPLKRKPVVRQVENTSVYSLEDWITGSINKGGAELVLQTYTGKITLKKR